MKVQLLVSRCGPQISQIAGDVVEVSAAEGARMIEAGQAVPARGITKETADAVTARATPKKPTQRKSKTERAVKD